MKEISLNIDELIVERLGRELVTRLGIKAGDKIVFEDVDENSTTVIVLRCQTREEKLFKELEKY